MTPPTPSPPLRADARRNREAILAAAREVFDRDGVLAPLDAIAVHAGVGNATLYRNFPTRDDLLAAVLETRVAGATEEALGLSERLPPREALAEWLISLAWQLRIWHDLPYCLAHANTSPEAATTSAISPLMEQTDRLLRAAQASGDAVPDLAAEELYELVTTLSWGVDRFGDDAVAARRRVRMGTAGVFT